MKGVAKDLRAGDTQQSLDQAFVATLLSERSCSFGRPTRGKSTERK